MSKPPSLELQKILVDLEPIGLRIRLVRYKVRQSATNYLPENATEDEESNGFTWSLRGRVPLKDLMKVYRIGNHDNSTSIDRYIYCLPEQQAAALDLLRNSIEDAVTHMAANAAKMKTVWDTRTETIETKKIKPAVTS